MSLQKQHLKRQFILDRNKLALADPDPEMSAAEVLKFYSRTYPELITASVVGPEYKDDKVVFTFKSVVGTKG